MKNFDLRSERFVFFKLFFEACDKAAEVRFILEVFVNASDVVMVPDCLEETDFGGSEILKENGVHLFSEHFKMHQPGSSKSSLQDKTSAGPSTVSGSPMYSKAATTITLSG